MPAQNQKVAVTNELLKWVGYKEGRNNHTLFGEWYAKKVNNKAFIETAWCGMYIDYCFYAVGLGHLVPMMAWTPSGYSWFKKRGQLTNDPQWGDLGFVWSPSAKRTIHVFFVTGRDGNYVNTAEGNTNTNGSPQGDGVYRGRRRITSRLLFVRPAYDRVQPTLPKSGVTQKAKPAQPTGETISLRAITYSAKVDPGRKNGTYTNRLNVLRFEKCLQKAGVLNAKYVDGHYGTVTIAACAAWQRKQGWRGADADGKPGPETLKRLAALGGYRVVG